MTGQLYVISGPSGSGKSTIIQLLRKGVTGLGYSVSHTSRRPRNNETNGLNYHFVDRVTFRRMIDEDAFVEWAEIYDDFYGTSFSSLNNQVTQGRDVVMDLDSQGAKNIKEHFKDTTLIYILPPSIEALEKRLRERDTDDAKVIGTRMAKALKEIQNCVWYQYMIINDDLHKAVRKVQSIIISQRCRKARMFPMVKEMFRHLNGA